MINISLDEQVPYRMRIMRLLKRYNLEDQMCYIGPWLAEYNGCEEDIIDHILASVENSTGCCAQEPPPEPYAQRLARFLEYYSPEEVRGLERSLEAFRGREEVLVMMMVKKYGPEPVPPTPSDSREDSDGDGDDRDAMFSGYDDDDLKDTFGSMATARERDLAEMVRQAEHITNYLTPSDREMGGPIASVQGVVDRPCWMLAP
eukprot:PhM_4_TR2462/c0_g5_i1/m.15320